MEHFAETHLRLFQPSALLVGAASQPDIKSEWGLIRVDQLWMQ